MSDDFSTLFEFLPIGAYRTRPDGGVLRVNPALARLNGYDSESEMRAAVADIGVGWYVDPGRRREFRHRLESQGRLGGFESEVRRLRTGEKIWVSENAHAVRAADGSVLHFEGTVEEITQQVRDRQALRASQEQLQQLLALVPGMFYRVVLQPDGQPRATFISPGARELLGVEPEAIIADGLLMRSLRHPDDRARVQAEAEAALQRGGAWQTEYRVVLRSGEIKWVQVLSAPAPPADGLAVRVGFAFDITAARQAAGLRLERDSAAAADQAKSQFLSRVSHELRTPLNAVLGFAQLLQIELADGERQRAWLAGIIGSGEHLLALMEDILHMASAQGGELPLQVESVPLQPLLQEVRERLGPMAQRAGVSIADALVAAAPLALRGDRRRVVQIVSNLVSNAIKYNRPGGWVRLAATSDGGDVVLSVADSGVGLTPEQIARLFQPFERVGAQRGPVAGTGLGLAVCRQLAQAMGGSVEVTSQPGQGSAFSLRLPQA